ncbi:hypothetical protein P170DRAFT_481123 [Aspergillus steynii IBT 23096]|uniref:Uncharacterized protein n=1 Tax=Aspergillus steynii IBT 23096 TaxID=1392250 RepID=A0A2I2FRB5_9EURO|nr:uncharacterized protein P170DRAFT_481123 [Aspergillus steynii IBT 23096]PLB43173.1 hypothetical protein P170DRAFT_481123 [Aspergillus steynii IBT 23096]
MPGQSGPSEPGAAGQPSATMTNPPDTDNRTAPHPEQENWSITNLHDILYVLRPGTENAKSRHRVHSNVGPIFGKMIRNLPVLPNRISSHVEGWRLETWMRLDRRVTPEDILDRINPAFRGSITEHEIEARRALFRQTFHIAHWGNQRSMNEISRMVRHSGRDPKLNSTRGLTPGLIVPAEGEAGGRIPLPPPPPVRNLTGPAAISPMPGQSRHFIQPNAAANFSFPGQYIFSFKAHSETVDTPGSRTPMNGNSQALNIPELRITYETPPKPRLRLEAPFVREFSQALVAQPRTLDTRRKRKLDVDADVFAPVSHAKRKKTRRETIPSFPEYPKPPLELAAYEGPPARFFTEPVEPEPEQEMNLERYMETNRLGYLDFLNARYFDDMDFPLNRGAGAWL